MRALILLALSLFLATSPAAAQQKKSLEIILARPLLSEHLVLREIQLFTAARVVAMPQMKDRADWETRAQRLREDVLRRVVFRGEAATWRDAKTGVEWLDVISGGSGYRIRKLRYEALPGVWIPALLYEPDKLTGKAAVHLALGGHERPLGKAAPNRQIRAINLVKRGMLVLSPEWLAMGQLRTANWDHDRLRQLDLCGTSGLAPFYLCMKRGLDVLLAQPHADLERVSVSGESGGGWQTILLSALDPRVKLCNPVAGYSSWRDGIWAFDVGDCEQSPCDLGATADYSHLTALLAPRPALLTYNAKDDCCFVAVHALPSLLDAATPIYRLYGRADALHWHVNHDPGTHNYDRDNREALYRMLGKYHFAGQRDYDAREIPCAAEVKTLPQLEVALPARNEDFNTLALKLSKNLPRHPALPATKDAASAWQRERRAKLRELVRAPTYAVKAIAAGTATEQDVHASYWWLKMGRDWTVPAVKLERGNSTPTRGTAVVVLEQGRRNAAAHVERLLAAGYRVLAVDPFGFGESRIDKRSHPARYRSEYVLVVDAVGERSLGIQSAQLAAVARWSRSARPAEPVTLVAVGPRAAACALIAAALDESAGAELHQSLGSLKQVLAENWTAAQKPEIFCFGLLEHFDIKQIAALVAPRPVVFVAPAPGMQTHLAGLKDWYGLLGTEFDPCGRKQP